MAASVWKKYMSCCCWRPQNRGQGQGHLQLQGQKQQQLQQEQCPSKTFSSTHHGKERDEHSGNRSHKEERAVAGALKQLGLLLHEGQIPFVMSRGQDVTQDQEQVKGQDQQRATSAAAAAVEAEAAAKEESPSQLPRHCSPLGVVDQPKVYVVALDGTISSGKSTCLALLQSAARHHGLNWLRILPEPIEQWCGKQSPADISLSEYYERETPENCLLFQLKILSSLMARHREIEREQCRMRKLMTASDANTANKDNDNPRGSGNSHLIPQGILFITERSIHSGRAFLATQESMGKLTAPQAYQLRRLFEEISAAGMAKPDLSVYLDIPVDMALDRLRWRGRTGESHIERSYLEELGAHLPACQTEPVYRIPVTETTTPESCTLEIVRVITNHLARLHVGQSTGQDTITYILLKKILSKFYIVGVWKCIVI